MADEEIKVEEKKEEKVEEKKEEKVEEEKKEEKVEEKKEEKEESKEEEKVEEKKEEKEEKKEEKEEKKEGDSDNKEKEEEEENIIEKQPNEFHSEWTFWFDKKISNKKAPSDKFEDALLSLGSFTTINDFWQLYAHITKPEDLPKSCNLRLFRNDIMPTWENYSGGGFWIVRFARSSNALNRIWEELVFALIGERFEDDGVVGVVLSLRKQEDYLSIWLKDNGIRFRVGEKLKQVLNLDGSSHIEYKFISHSLRDRSTCRNSKSYALPQ